MNPHRNKKTDFLEATQLVLLFKEIQYDSFANHLNSIFSNKLNFLKENVKLLQTGKINLENCFSKSKNQKLIISIDDEEKDKFLESLSNRIYKTRNYIVHTKKGESSDSVFDPSHNNLEKLTNEVKLIREISRLLLLKASTDIAI